MSVHVKKGDMVEVMTGDDRGRRGKVLRVDPVNRKVVVEGVNRVFKHVRPSRRNPRGGRLQVERPVDVSNIKVVSPKTDRPTRVRFVVDGNGKKTRVDVQGNPIDVVRHAQS